MIHDMLKEAISGPLHTHMHDRFLSEYNCDDQISVLMYVPSSLNKSCALLCILRLVFLF